MLKEFKAFILRGNVVDLAVGVVIGVAFKSVIDSLVANVFTPIIGAVGATDFRDVTVTLRGGSSPVVLRYGQFITDLISFLLIAVVVFFFVVKPMNVLAAAATAVRSRRRQHAVRGSQPAHRDTRPAPPRAE